MLEHDRVAGDLPARVETHATFGIGKHLHALGIEPVETGVREHVPVRRLKIVQAVDLAVAVEVARRIGARLQAVREGSQRQFDAWRKSLAVIAQQRAGILVETGKAQAFQQAARLALSRLF